MAETERPLRTFCPECGKVGDCVVVRRPASIEFAGKTYDTEEEFVRCKGCGGEFDMPGLLDPLRQVYDAYRRERGFPSAEEIRAMRLHEGWTEEELAVLLGTNRSTIRLYERGALPSDEHGERLRILCSRIVSLPPMADRFWSILPTHPERPQSVPVPGGENWLPSGLRGKTPPASAVVRKRLTDSAAETAA